MASVAGSAGGTTTESLPGAAAAREKAEAETAEAAEAEKKRTQSRGSSFTALKARSEERLDEVAAAEAAEAEELEKKSKLSRKERRAKEKAASNLEGSFEDYSHLDALRPKEKYVFASDYFRVDGQFATILAFFHDDAANDGFGAFWGINRIASGLDERVTTVITEQVARKTEKWTKDHIKASEKLDKLEESEAEGSGGSKTAKRRQQKVSADMEEIIDEIQNGAAYLHVHMRMMVKAPSLAVLDDSVQKISELYVDRFGTLKVAPYHGEMRQELQGLFTKNEHKRGKGFGFTSTEFAGAHSLVTNGLNDPTGEYVGTMTGDVNSSAVMWDVDKYNHHVVVADENVNEVLGRAYTADMWGSKVSQVAMLNNNRVVHIVLDGADLDRLGPRFENITARMDMNSGDINMFEMFGKEEDELSIFPAHLEKIVLMAEQAYEPTENDRSIIRGMLTETLTQFYIDKQMWARNAKTNRDRLRVVNIPHTHVPRLQDLVSYFDTQHKRLSNSVARDDEELHAYSVLRVVFKNLLDNNGDLFNTHTNDEIDNTTDAQRVLYDFSRLMKRGKGVAMAQLVNTIGFAVDALDTGDVVVIHGTERIDDRVKQYINTQFEHLFHRGGRVAYLYNDVEKMLDDERFNRFGKADWTILGSMSDATVDRYQKMLHQEIPPDLERLLTAQDDGLCYLRRGHTNVVFVKDLPLGINPARAQRRAELMAAAESIRGSRGSANRGGRVDSAGGSLEEVNRLQSEAMTKQPEQPRQRMKKRRRGPSKGPNASVSGTGAPRMSRRR